MFATVRRFFSENRGPGHTIAKNTFWLFFGQTVSRLLRATLIIAAARILGPEEWGVVSYVMTLIAFLTIVSDIGLSAVITREAASNHELGSRYFSAALTIKSLLLTLGACVLILGNGWITNIPGVQVLLPLAVLILVFDSLRNFSFAINRALEKMQWEAIDEIATNLFIIAVGFYMLIAQPNAYGLIVAYAIGTAGGLVVALFFIRRHLYILRPNTDYQLIKQLLTSAVPFALASFLGAIMINTDMVMIGWLRPIAELGYYSAAQKPVQILYTFASLFATALFPTLSRIADDKNGSFRATLESSLTSTIAVALPIAIGGIILGSQLMTALFGLEYSNGIASFQILIATVLIIFPSVIVSNAILAKRAEKDFIIFSCIGAIGNVIFNYIFIQWWGIAGCALSTLLTQIIANAFIWKRLRRMTDFSIAGQLTNILRAAVLMGIAVAGMAYAHFNIYIIVSAGITLYSGLLYVQKEPVVMRLLQ